MVCLYYIITHYSQSDSLFLLFYHNDQISVYSFLTQLFTLYCRKIMLNYLLGLLFAENIKTTRMSRLVIVRTKVYRPSFTLFGC